MKILGIVLLLACAAAGSAADSDAVNPLNVTFVANCGYLVECDGHKIAIDALFGGLRSTDYDMPSDSVVALMTAARPPFNDLDIIAITHFHQDHFDAAIVVQHLVNNPSGIVLCPPQVAALLAEQPEYSQVKERIIAQDASMGAVSEFKANGIDVLTLTSKHGAYFDVDSAGARIDLHRDIQHREYLFTIGGRKVLHVGDVYLGDRDQYVPLGLGEDSIDLAFVQRWGCHDLPSFGEKLIRERVMPRHVYFTHLAPGVGAKLAGQPACASHDRIALPTKSLESWLIP